MVTSENGIIHTHIYICAVYITYVYMYCTHVLDVSKRGVLGSADDDIAFFLHILSILVVIYFFADHEHVEWTNTCIFYLLLYNTILHFFCIVWHCSCFFLQFTCSTIHMEDTGQSKMRQTFWSFRGFRTKYTGLELECHPGFFKVFQD